MDFNFDFFRNVYLSRPGALILPNKILLINRTELLCHSYYWNTDPPANKQETKLNIDILYKMQNVWQNNLNDSDQEWFWLDYVNPVNTKFSSGNNSRCGGYGISLIVRIWTSSWQDHNECYQDVKFSCLYWTSLLCINVYQKWF